MSFSPAPNLNSQFSEYVDNAPFTGCPICDTNASRPFSVHVTAIFVSLLPASSDFGQLHYVSILLVIRLIFRYAPITTF